MKQKMKSNANLALDGWRRGTVAVLPAFVNIQTTDRQNVDFQILQSHYNVHRHH
jgi:hypothetical protein